MRGREEVREGGWEKGSEGMRREGGREEGRQEGVRGGRKVREGRYMEEGRRNKGKEIGSGIEMQGRRRGESQGILHIISKQKKSASLPKHLHSLEGREERVRERGWGEKREGKRKHRSGYSVKNK